MQLSLILLEQLKECFQKCAQVLQFNEWGARPVVVQCNHCQSFQSSITGQFISESFSKHLQYLLNL